MDVIHTHIEQILTHYFEEAEWRLEKKESGVNNTTRFIEYGGERYVLRIYDNHADEDKVAYEIGVLEQLQGSSLSFAVPRPKRTLEGRGFTRLASGKIAVLFEYIEGQRADLSNMTQVFYIGQAVGELVAALAQVQIRMPSAYEPYYALDEIHPLVTRDKLNDWMNAMLAGPQAREVQLLREAILQLDLNLTELKRLPVQLVHSDIVGGNVLANGDQISGILDFEFVTPDLRAMEAAVFISELVRHYGERVELVEAFVKGYRTQASLTRKELDYLPQLILLRSLVLCIHFLGRQWAMLDRENRPETFLSSFAQVHAWLEEHQDWLISLFND